MGIYRSEKSREMSLALYDRQLSKLGAQFRDIYISTSFGKTHLTETGSSTGKPLLVFHGGNATTAYNLLKCSFLLDDFHVYAVDTIGHPGKSDEVCLSHRGYDYGKWASEVIDGIGFDRIACFGGSFGGGILAKLMCTSPEKVERAVLVVPAGISNAVPVSSAAMLLPLIQYRLTKKEKYLINAALYMALDKALLDEDTKDIIRDSFDNVKIKAAMPSDVSSEKMSRYNSPALVIACEKDCLFPAERVLPRAKKIIRKCRTVKLMGSGHIHLLPRRVKSEIIDFLKKEP